MKLYDQLRDVSAYELFGKSESELKLHELSMLSEYIRDRSSPAWKTFSVGGRSDVFEISNIGDVRRVADGKLIPQYVNNSGYRTVWLHLPRIKNSYPMLVHRLVAEAFVPNPNAKPEVNHLTAIQTCNWSGNLEWVTATENIRHMIKMGHQVVGKDHPNTRFTEDQIRAACKLLEDPHIKLRDIVADTGVSIKTIKHIRFNNGWSHISKDYDIVKSKRRQGPVYAPISRMIIELIKVGKTNVEIREELKKSGLDSNISTKSISDRICHIRKTMSV